MANLYVLLTFLSFYFLTDDGQIIERASYSGILLPGPDWYTRTHNGPTASLIYRIRVVCDIHYYNTTCTKFCRPRNDTFGHYKCDSHGDKVCMDGWMGSECDKGLYSHSDKVCMEGLMGPECDKELYSLRDKVCMECWMGSECDQNLYSHGDKGLYSHVQQGRIQPFQKGGSQPRLKGGSNYMSPFKCIDRTKKRGFQPPELPSESATVLIMFV